jgi:hypothetical protein
MSFEHDANPRAQQHAFPALAAALIVCCLLLCGASCASNKTYKVDDITRHPSVANCKRPLDHDFESSRLFSERFINAYLNVLRREVKPNFYHSFYLGKEPFQIKAIFSSDSESFIHISPGANNELQVQCVEYPVQMSLFTGLGIEGQNARLKISPEDALKMYQAIPGIFAAADEDSVFYAYDFTLDLARPKAINVSKRSIAVLMNVRILTTKINPKLSPVVFDHINFINSDKDFSWALEKADETATDIVTTEMQELFNQSEFF